ncbi:hypothetical protein ACET3Z_017232 [Daucus carota]
MAASFNVVRYDYSPCAACKLLRRKCLPDCIFAPYFPPEELQKFISVPKIFGASNVAKLLNEVLPHQREDTVSSLSYEAEARLRDPVYGCVGHYPDICGSGTTAALPATGAVPVNPMCDYTSNPPQITGEAGICNYYQTPSSFSFPWNDTNVPDQGGAAGQGL